MVIPFRVRRFNRRRALPSIAHSFGDGRPNSNDLRDESDMHIQFRPWCGVKLRRWYRRRRGNWIGQICRFRLANNM